MMGNTMEHPPAALEGNTKIASSSVPENMRHRQFEDIEETVEQPSSSSVDPAKYHECSRLLMKPQADMTPPEEGKNASPESTRGLANLCIPEYEIVPESTKPADQWHNCQDDHDHRNFIPVDNLDLVLNHVRPALRNQKTKDVLQEYSDRTVRITVEKYSTKRPDFFLESDVEFPGGKEKGAETTLYGTGFVIPGKVHFDDKCPCKQCARSNNPKMKFQTLYVLTASHVVYDDEEAEESTFDLNYNTRYLSDSRVKQFFGLKLDDGDEYKDDDDNGDGGDDDDDDEGGSGGTISLGTRKRIDDGNDTGAFESTNNLKHCLSLIPGSKDCQNDDTDSNSKDDGSGDEGAKSNNNDTAIVTNGVEAKPVTDDQRPAGDDRNYNSSYWKLLAVARNLARNDGCYKLTERRDAELLEDDDDIFGTCRDMLISSKGLGFPFGHCNVIVDDHDSFLQKVRDKATTVLSEIESSGEQLAKKLHETISKFTNYDLAIVRGDVVLATHIMLLRIEDMKRYDNKEVEDKTTNSNSSSSLVDLNEVFHCRQKTFDAISNAASLIQSRWKDDLEDASSWSKKAFASFSLLEKEMDRDRGLMNDSFRCKIKAMTEKAFNMMFFLERFKTTVCDMSNGDMKDIVEFLMSVIDCKVAEENVGSRDDEDDGDGENEDIGMRNHFNRIFNPYFKDFDAYMAGTVYIFLNLLIPLFWEENFSGFASDETGIQKALHYQCVFWILLFGRFTEDIKTFLRLKPDQPIVDKANSEHFLHFALSFSKYGAKSLSMVGQESTDTMFRRYTTEQVVVKCVTHDPCVIDRFSKMDFLPPKLPLTFIVSHPHGYFKRISFGNSKTISGSDHFYVEFNLKQNTKYRLTKDAVDSLPDAPNIPPFHMPPGVAMEPAKEYRLHQDLHLAVPYKVFVDTLNGFSTTTNSNSLPATDNTWLKFPSGAASILEDQQKPVLLPDHLEFCSLTEEGRSSFESIKHCHPHCVTHGIQTCGGCSGSLLHDVTSTNYLMTHCGADYGKDGKKIGYSSLTRRINGMSTGEATLKDVLRVRPSIFVGGRHVPIFPGPKT